MYGTIKEIPIQMLCCAENYRGFADTLEATQAQYPLFGQCNHRCFERLLGYIDVDLCSIDGL